MFAGFHDRMFVDHNTLNTRYRSLFDIDRLHVRAVHNTWGIADGLYVELVDDGIALTVTEGFGFDNEGTPLGLTTTTHLQPGDVGEYEIALTERGLIARPLAAHDHCAGSLVLASVHVVLSGAEALRWIDLRVSDRLVRPRHSAFVRHGSSKVNNPGSKIVVSTSAARFATTPLYFCTVVDLDSAVENPTPTGLWTLAALIRAQGVGSTRHGPFFTICGATKDSFNVLFTRWIGAEHPRVRIDWVGVVSNRPVRDLLDPCQDYPFPDPGPS